MCYCIFRCFFVDKLGARGNAHDGVARPQTEDEAHVGPYGLHENQVIEVAPRGQRARHVMMLNPRNASAPHYVEVQAVPVMAAPVYVDDTHIELSNCGHDHGNSLSIGGESIQPIEDELGAVEEAALSAHRANRVSPDRLR